MHLYFMCLFVCLVFGFFGLLVSRLLFFNVSSSLHLNTVLFFLFYRGRIPNELKRVIARFV